MTRTARIWINGGQQHDEEFCFEGFLNFFQKLKDVEAKRQIRIENLQLHGEVSTSQKFRLPPKGDVEVDVLPSTAQGAPTKQQQRWQELQQQRQSLQQQHEAIKRKAEQIQEINDQLNRQEIDNRISGEKDRAMM